MSEKNHKDQLYNNLDEKPAGQNTIEVYVKEGGVRRGAFKNGDSELKPGTHRELIDIRNKPDIHLIIRSREVPARNGKGEGLKIHLPDKMKPHHFEMRRVSGNQVEIDLHFKDGLSNKEIVTHLDPKVEHPVGE